MKSILCLFVSAAFTAAAHSSVLVTFGETVPTANVFQSYQPANPTGNNWHWQSAVSYKPIAETIVMPTAGEDYLLSKISMQLTAAAPNFVAPSGFSISFYKLALGGDRPTTGELIGTQTGTMQSTAATATAGSYFTFHLDTPILMEAGSFYSYVLAFDGAQSYNNLALGLGPRVSSGNAWESINGANWSLPGATTWVYSLQGISVPEPQSVALLGGAAFLLLLLKRRNAKD